MQTLELAPLTSAGDKHNIVRYQTLDGATMQTLEIPPLTSAGDKHKIVRYQTLEISPLTSDGDKHDMIRCHLAKSYQCHIVHIVENRYPCFL